MDEKQQRLIDYFTRLRPPARPVTLAGGDAGLDELIVQPPSAPTLETVRGILEQRQQRPADGLELAVEEGTVTTGTTPGGLLRRPAPVEQPLSEAAVETALSATEKALRAQEMTLPEQDLFEAIVLPGLRPVLDVIDGNISSPPAGWEFLDDFRATIAATVPAVGRVNLPELVPAAPYGGTGFFVGDGLLMTNRHVAKLFIEGVGAKGQLSFHSNRDANVSPAYEVGDAETDATSSRFEMIEPLLVHPYWDMALLRVKPLGDTPMPRPLRLTRSKPANFGSGASPSIVVIGYPALDGRSDLAEQMNIFRNIFGCKRLLPGYLNGFDKVQTRWQATLDAVTHDASTLGGNSGSAVVDLTTGEVLALHFAGRYLVANYGVPSWEMALDSHITDLGVNFSEATGSPNGAGAASPVWLGAWHSVAPARTGESATPKEPASAPSGLNGRGLATTETPVLPVAPDWFERVSDADLVEAYRRDPGLTEQLIRETLLAAEADDLLNDLAIAVEPPAEATVEEGVIDFLLGRGKTDPTLPEIIFLHGIMGGHLAAFGGLGGRVWLSPLAFVAGGVAHKLTLQDDGEQEMSGNPTLFPDGHVRLVYEKASRKWRMAGFAVHAFSFDWRKPLTNAADRLHLYIEGLRLERPSKRFALVGHSMGGLVAALYAARHPQWSARVSQTILLGAPLRGSFAPIEALLGAYPVLKKVALADTEDDERHLAAAVRTLPGLIDMLPDPEIFPDAEPLYRRAIWPQTNAPAQVWLDQSRQLKRLIVASPVLESARLIVTTTLPTVGEVTIAGGMLTPGKRQRPGDGTAPARSAAASLPGMTVFGATSSHGDLPREQAVIDAVEQLLRTGACDLPPVSQATIQDTTPIEEAPVAVLDESVSGDLAARLTAGIFTQRDVTYLLRADESTLPGAVGASVGG